MCAAGRMQITELVRMAKVCIVKQYNLEQVPSRKSLRVSWCEATHCRSARALQTRFEACAVRLGGESIGYIETISCKSADIVPNECHRIGARSEKASRFFDNSSKADSR